MTNVLTITNLTYHTIVNTNLTFLTITNNVETSNITTNVIDTLTTEVAAMAMEKSVSGFVTFSCFLIGLTGLLLATISIRYYIDKNKLDKVAKKVDLQRNDLVSSIEENKNLSIENKKTWAELEKREKINIDHFAGLWINLGMEAESEKMHDHAMARYLNALEILVSKRDSPVSLIKKVLIFMKRCKKHLVNSNPSRRDHLISWIAAEDSGSDLQSIGRAVYSYGDNEVSRLFAEVENFFLTPPSVRKVDLSAVEEVGDAATEARSAASPGPSAPQPPTESNQPPA